MMGAMKRYAEAVSDEMGFNGEINDEVMTEGNRRIRAASIRTALDQLGVVPVMCMTKGMVAFEISRIIGQKITYAEITAAFPPPPEK